MTVSHVNSQQKNITSELFHSEVFIHLSCQVICCCWSAVFYQVQSQRSVYQETLEHFMLLSADQLYGDADFLFQQDLAAAHSAKTISNWFADHGITVHD